jgi:regulator of RNase E activity RraA
VRPGDLIHADSHGAIVVPFDAAEKLPAACDVLMRREAVILDVARSADFTIDALKAAMAKSAEIH